jgi:hypothetical protein
MAEAVDTYGVSFRDGTITCMARIVGADAVNLTQSDLSSGTYSVFLLDDQDADSRIATQHVDHVVTIASVIFDTLQTDARWTVDDTGYNFRHTIDISSSEAFTIAGRRYLVEYKFTPASGQVIIVRFRPNTI